MFVNKNLLNMLRKVIMKIIDFDRKGNLVRFYLGNKDCYDYWGDDWDDAPYEHNAGRVYEEYIESHVDVVFPFEGELLEPSCGVVNSMYCKDDFKKNKCPCLIYVPKDICEDSWYSDNFNAFVGNKNIIKYYYEDTIIGEYPQDKIICYSDFKIQR